ncbi:hypothetical protein [Pseudomonas sp. S9]|uniref:hypothetical protein n=1 Tax=Pseudomonas sp. S9 TaxID=686578 RepID=UPI0002557145|nr:hypothetical protein [Pseudomonas sp. S9]
MVISYGQKISDTSWGCEFTEVLNSTGVEFVKLCHVHVSQISQISQMLAASVVDTSWMVDLDEGAKEAYEYTVQETADQLINIFKSAEDAGSVVDEFGELMVSMGAAKSLEVVFKNTLIPIAELWKPQAKQNEGFDFHSVCGSDYLNFGEAKYSSGSTSYGVALDQAARFVLAKKHKRDYVHLVNLASPASIKNLNNNLHGIVAAFSINAKDPLIVYRNSLQRAIDFAKKSGASFVYMVGVTHEN